MGQAKQRGSFEERKAVAIERNKELEIARLQEEAHKARLRKLAAEENRTSERSKRNTRALAMTAMCIGVGLAGLSAISRKG